MAYYARGGASFFLVKAPSQGLIYSFGGEKGPDLLGKGVNGTEGQEYRTVVEALEGLRPRAAVHALRPPARIVPREATEERGSRAY